LLQHDARTPHASGLPRCTPTLVLDVFPGIYVGDGRGCGFVACSRRHSSWGRHWPDAKMPHLFLPRAFSYLWFILAWHAHQPHHHYMRHPTHLHTLLHGLYTCQHLLLLHLAHLIPLPPMHFPCRHTHAAHHVTLSCHAPIPALSYHLFHITPSPRTSAHHTCLPFVTSAMPSWCLPSSAYYYCCLLQPSCAHVIFSHLVCATLFLPLQHDDHGTIPR